MLIAIFVFSSLKIHAVNAHTTVVITIIITAKMKSVAKSLNKIEKEAIKIKVNTSGVRSSQTIIFLIDLIANFAPIKVDTNNKRVTISVFHSDSIGEVVA